MTGILRTRKMVKRVGGLGWHGLRRPECDVVEGYLQVLAVRGS